MYDVIIIGAGPAGLAAALDCSYLELRSLVIDSGQAGGALSQVYPWKPVDSFLGFFEKHGQEIADMIVSHVKKTGVKIHENEHVDRITGKGPFTIKTQLDEYRAKAVIVATGIRGIPRKLGVPGQDLKGIMYCLKDPQSFTGKNVLVIGGGDSAADSALGLAGAGAHVWMAHRRDKLRATDESRDNIKKSSIKMLWNHEAQRFTGDGRVSKAWLLDNKSSKVHSVDVDAVVLCISSVPTNECIRGTGVKTENASISVDSNGMTSVPGIFAAGDIVTKLKRIPQATATGERAAYSAYMWIKNPYWK